MLVVRHAVVGPFAANAYLVGCSDTAEAIVIDPGGDPARVLGMREPGGFRVVRIVCTHGHIDHVACAADTKRLTGAPLQIHASDQEWLAAIPQQAEMFGFEEACAIPDVDRFHVDGETFAVGRHEATILHTPGHTRGSCCIHFDRARTLFTGDTLFVGSVGRTDLPGGSFEDLERSIRERLFTLDDAVRFYPGHGPSGILGDERRSNPFVGEQSPRGRFV